MKLNPEERHMRWEKEDVKYYQGQLAFHIGLKLRNMNDHEIIRIATETIRLIKLKLNFIHL